MFSPFHDTVTYVALTAAVSCIVRISRVGVSEGRANRGDPVERNRNEGTARSEQVTGVSRGVQRALNAHLIQRLSLLRRDGGEQCDSSQCWLVYSPLWFPFLLNSLPFSPIMRSQGSLPSGTYYILDGAQRVYVGRSLREDCSVLPKPIVSVAPTEVHASCPPKVRV